MRAASRAIDDRRHLDAATASSASWCATSARSTPRASGCCDADQRRRPDRPARLGHRGRRFDPLRADADQGRASTRRSTSAMGDRDRGRPQAHRRARHQGADDRPPGRRPHRRPGAGPAGPAGAEGAARQDRQARIQAGRRRPPIRRRLAKGIAPLGSQILPYTEGRRPTIAVKRTAIITGDQLIDARQGFEQDRPTRRSSTSRFNSAGRHAASREMTQENVGKPLRDHPRQSR